MERKENGLMGDNTPPSANGDEGSVLSSVFFLDHVGEVVLTHTSDGLSWQLFDSSHNVSDSCFYLILLVFLKNEIFIFLTRPSCFTWICTTIGEFKWKLTVWDFFFQFCCTYAYMITMIVAVS